ncbi:MAG TPA: DUF72 domain-containing protein [Candidatus Binatia bacterium]|nr:DUF72 domain-containing protein [Candidatus Binatia bacterium]
MPVERAPRGRAATGGRRRVVPEPLVHVPAPDLDPEHDPGPEVAAARAAEVEDAATEPIVVPGGGEVRVGTASWTDPTMVAPGVFYPPDADTAEERLAYYASRFPVVEVDATYYALPSPRTAALWVERTPPDFVFDVKAFALFTGQPSEVRRLPKVVRAELPAELAERSRIYGKDLPAELLDALWSMFREGIAPLVEAGQLGAVFLQYPRWVYTSSEARAAITEARERLAGLPVGVEFRNGTWLNEKNAERTLRFLEEIGAALVVVDEPQGFRSSVPPIVATTSSDLAVVRFHGRRSATWEGTGVPPVERFRYLYSRAELEEWVPRVRELARQVRATHLLMNNCYANYGATNARELAALLARDLAGASGAVADGRRPAGGA